MLPIHSPGQALAGAFIAKQAVTLAGDAVSETGNFLSQLTSKVKEGVGKDGTPESGQPQQVSELLSDKSLFGGHSSIKDQAVALRKRVAGRLHQLLAQNGISLGNGVNLTTNSLGQVQVVGNHPDKGMIESLLAGDQDLTNDIRQLSSLESLLKAAKETEEFQKAYAKDPAKAVQDYSHLFEDNEEDQVVLRLGNSFFNVEFL